MQHLCTLFELSKYTVFTLCIRPSYSKPKNLFIALQVVKLNAVLHKLISVVLLKDRERLT